MFTALQWISAACIALLPGRLVPGPQDACTGCIGVGGTASASGGSCGGLVVITVQVEHGKCRWAATDDPLYYECRQIKPCKPTITRTWSGLPPDTPVDHCVVVGGERFCLSPKPSSGADGSGTSVRTGPSLDCSDDPADQLTFTVESATCELAAQVTASCSVCTGNW
jgi:hypothetical protein